MDSSFYPFVQVDASPVNYRRRGRYLLRARSEGSYDGSIHDFMDSAVTELLWHIPSGISLCTGHEIVRISHHGNSGEGLCVDFVVDIC